MLPTSAGSHGCFHSINVWLPTVITTMLLSPLPSSGLVCAAALLFVWVLCQLGCSALAAASACCKVWFSLSSASCRHCSSPRAGIAHAPALGMVDAQGAMPQFPEGEWGWFILSHLFTHTLEFVSILPFYTRLCFLISTLYTYFMVCQYLTSLHTLLIFTVNAS